MPTDSQVKVGFRVLGFRGLGFRVSTFSDDNFALGSKATYAGVVLGGSVPNPKRERQRCGFRLGQKFQTCTSAFLLCLNALILQGPN